MLESVRLVAPILFAAFAATISFRGAIADDAPKTVVRVYPVDDLLLVSDDYPFRTSLPTTVPLDGVDSSSGLGAFGTIGGGMGGGGFGGGGGGFFAVADPSVKTGTVAQSTGQISSASAAGSSRHERQQRQGARLTAVIRSFVRGDWDQVEEYNCELFGRNLIVRQTEDGHREISDLLQALRKGGGSVRSVTIEATWLALDGRQTDAGAPAGGSDAERRAIRVLDSKRFGELLRQGTSYHGRLTCLNGQTVHFATGQRRVISRGGIPTVGVGAAGYSPITNVVNVGAVLQVTPTVSSDGKTAVVDLQSVVTQWNPPSEPLAVTARSLTGSTPEKAEGPLVTHSVTVDRVNLGTQEWSTTASLPLGVPVLIASVSLPEQPADGKTQGRPDLALVIEVRAQ